MLKKCVATQKMRISFCWHFCSILTLFWICRKETSAIAIANFFMVLRDEYRNMKHCKHSFSYGNFGRKFFFNAKEFSKLNQTHFIRIFFWAIWNFNKEYELFFRKNAIPMQEFFIFHCIWIILNYVYVRISHNLANFKYNKYRPYMTINPRYIIKSRNSLNFPQRCSTKYGRF